MTIFKCLLLMPGLFITFFQDGIKDPLQDYLEGSRILASSYVWGISQDLNGDGLKDVCLAKNDGRGGRDGLIWTVYVNKRNSYLRLDDAMIFRQDEVYYVTTEHLSSGPMILSFFPAGADKSSLIANKLIENKVERFKFEGPLSLEAIRAKHASLLTTQTQIRPVAMSLRNLANHYSFQVYDDPSEYLRYGLNDRSLKSIGPKNPPGIHLFLSGDERTSRGLKPEPMLDLETFRSSIMIPSGL